MGTKYAACVLLGLACAAPVAIAAESPPTFRVQLQDPIPGARDWGITGMNNKGELVGYHYTEAAVRSYIWQNGRATQLKDAPGLIDVGNDPHDVYALGINDAGTIVGDAYLAGDRVRGSIAWSSRDAQPQPLPQRTPFGTASAINNKGTIAGAAYESPGYPDDSAVLWRPSGQTTMWRANAADPDGRLLWDEYDYEIGVDDVNEHDQAVGYVTTPHVEDAYRPGHWSTRFQAMFWDGEQSHLLESTEADWNFESANAINNDGEIVGLATRYEPYAESPSEVRAVSWVDGVMRFLDGAEGAERSYANDINAHGWIVGGIDGDAVLWLDGKALSLDSLLDASDGALGSFDIKSASFVNDRGQILVSGLLNGSSSYALLTPVPEPSTMALAIGGLAVLAWRARKTAKTRGRA